MKKLFYLRIALTVLTVAGMIGCGFAAAVIWMIGHSQMGVGDGAPSPGPTIAGDIILGLIAAVCWLFLASPYLCVLASAWEWVKPKWRRRNYLYSMVMLWILTLVLFVLGRQRGQPYMIANLAMIWLWWKLYRATLVKSETN